MDEFRISAGKMRGLQRLADERGRFRMLAIDQRGSLERMLQTSIERAVQYDDLAAIKRIIVKTLAPYSSAVLIDPVYGYPGAIKYFPKKVGLLIASEETGAEQTGATSKERKSHLIEGWNVLKTRRMGADAVKLLVYYRADVSPQVLQHQQALVRQVGKECENYDIPFVLEVVSYPFRKDEEKDTPDYAKRKPEMVFDAVREFSKEEYKVDLLKVEFPADLKYCREFADGEFDAKRRESVYSLSEVNDFCRRVDELSRVPWVVLSAGVDIREFIENVAIATKNGASGFLCGRAIWKGCVQFYPDLEAIEQWLLTTGVDNFLKLYSASAAAVPYFMTKQFASYPQMKLVNQGENWYKNY